MAPISSRPRLACPLTDNELHPEEQKPVRLSPAPPTAASRCITADAAASPGACSCAAVLRLQVSRSAIGRLFNERLAIQRFAVQRLVVPRLALQSLAAGLNQAQLLPARLGALLLVLALGGLLLLDAAPALAADLQVSEVRLERCPAADIGSQPDLSRPAGASCYALRGVVVNPTPRPVIDTDVFARILDASGEPVLPNRTRVGSIGDIPPGRSDFALRLAVPAGTPEPLTVRNAKARGFSAPVRTRVAEGEERLPLEQALAPE